MCALPVARPAHGPGDLLDKAVFVRELLPKDLKFELNSLEEDEALAIAHDLASVVAVAHARQLDARACAKWLEGFRRGSAQNMLAPEGAYLEHCRKHALNAPDVAAQVAAGGVVSHHASGD